MKKSLSITSANLLYLITMLLVILVGSVLQMLNLSLGLIATEIFLILLPALIFLWVKKIPLKDGLRLKRISLPVAIVTFFLGVCTYLFSVLIELTMANLTGLPSVDLSQSTLPAGVWQSVFYFIGIAICAPICEEVLFRGAIQGSYEERKSATFAIIVPAVMFAFYHFRLSGLPGLLPVAFLLGYVAWRSRSILGTMLIHFGMNAAAATISILSFSGSELPGLLFGNTWILLAGLVLALGLLYLFIRIQPKPETREAVDEPKNSWFKKYWTLIVAGILYLVIVGATLYAQLSGQTASTTLTFSAPELDQPVESRYMAVDPAGNETGEMVCVLTPDEETLILHCDERIDAFEVQLDSSYFKEIGHTAELDVVWQKSTFEVLSYHYERNYGNEMSYSSDLEDSFLTTVRANDSSATEVPEGALLEYEWLWRVNNLEVSNGLFFKPSFVNLSRWDDALKDSVPVVTSEVLHVQGEEKLSLPAGEFKAWKVSISPRTVWYGNDDGKAPRPVKFDDGMVVYSLLEE